ncbi:VPA1269 family protein [Vibrio pomeroyi]|uniref:VPA1269 family protein n=1 Tax=Vibrio pomeroyi TaxID=198832 RepID=UPI0021C3AB6D|nr:VPA1269 family protein [Vibrio pomeroyi]
MKKHKLYTLLEIKLYITQALEQEGTKPESIDSMPRKYQTLRKNDSRMPARPNAHYSKNGWISYRDLFGLSETKFYPIEELRSVIKEALEQENTEPNSIVHLQNKYRALREKDARMPSTPRTYYALKGWKSYRNLFGLPDINLYSLTELKSAIAQALNQEGIDSNSIGQIQNKYHALRKNDVYMPSNPDKYYAKEGWKGYRDLFGLPDAELYSFEELRSVIRQTLKQEGTEPDTISNLNTKYDTLRKTNTRIPSTPHKYYVHKGWKSYRDLFGLPSIDFYSLEELKSAIRQTLTQEGITPESIRGLTNKYQILRRNNSRMPAVPYSYYSKKGWKSLPDLFGLPDIEFYPFEELKSTIKQILKREGTEPESIISTCHKYRALSVKDVRMPAHPNIYYEKKGWKSFPDLFGLPDAEFYQMKVLKSIIRQTLEQEGTKPESISNLYRKYLVLRENDDRMPSHPSEYYPKTEWKGYRDLFGLPNIKYYSLKELKSTIKYRLNQEDTGLESISALTEKYSALRKNDARMPSTPGTYYASKGWKGLYNLFDLPEKDFYLFEELQSTIKQMLKQENSEPISLGRLQKKYHALREKDVRMPSTPHTYYAKKGWTNFRDLFGFEYYPFEELKFVIKQKLKQKKVEPESINSLRNEYIILRKQDVRMPSTPQTYYADKGWKNYRNLFGLSESRWYSYHEAQNAIQAYLKKNENINLNKITLTHLVDLIAENDPKMPDSPNVVYREHWLGFEYFCQRKSFYNFLEARQIAKCKGYTENEATTLSYARLRIEDSMFPQYPEKAYLSQWRTLQHFFGVNDGRYNTLSDAQRSAVKIANQLGIKITSRTYPEIAKLDARLPPSIDRYKPYQDEWKGWKEFSGTMKYDIDKARAVAVENKWFRYKEYEKNYRNDVKLPAEPVKYYGLSSYEEFVEFSYWDIKHVKKYCEDNKISSIREYIIHAKKNVYLKVRYQAIEGFTKASEFLYKANLFDNIEYLGFKQWAKIARQFLSSNAKRGFQTKSKHINQFLIHLISKNALPSKPFKLFIAGNYIEPIEPLIKRSHNGKYLESTIIEFVKFVMEDCCYDRDEDTGELISINPDFHFRHPYQNVNVELESKGRPNQTIKPPLDFVYIDTAKQFIIPDFVHDDKGNKRPCTSFSDLINAHKLFESDWFEVDKNTYKRAINDPSCATKTQVITKKVELKEATQKVYKIWSPVRAIAMYLLFSLPLRGIQVCYLDSGEADSDKLIEQEDGSLAWVPNDNLLAGQLNNKGFLHREIGDEVGMNVSTNKTSTKEGGYTVPWMPLDVAKWVIRLRDWQSTYNPLNAPTSWSDIATPTEMHQKVLKKRGGQCFLFRDPRDSLKRKTNPPGSQPFLPNSAYRAFEKLLYLIQNDDIPLAQIRTGRNGSRDSDFQSNYSPHSLRVSHVSALLFEGDGLDPVIVQKLVGHANLVMTIYYGVINSEQMRDKLTSQYKEIAANKQKQYQASLLSRNLEEAKGELIYLSNGAGQVAWENSAMRFKDSGICPVANGRCDEGGLPINPNAKTLIYARAKSCYQCRFFVTGPAFLGGLVAKFNEVNVARKRANSRIESLEGKKKKIRLKKKQTEDQQLPTDNIKLQLEQINTSIDAEQVKFYDISTDQAAIFGKVLKCIRKINDASYEKNDTQGVALILNRTKAEVGVSLNESSDFRILAEVCEDAQIYDSIDDSEAVNLRAKYLDSMLTNNGFDAMFFQLDEEQSRFIGNQMQKLLLNRLKGWKSVEKLIYGDMQLLDLMTDNDGNFQILKEEMSLIINGSNIETYPMSVQKVES